MITRFLAGSFGAVLALLVSFSPLQAQTPSPGAIAAAREFVELKGAKTMFDVVVAGVIETVKNTFLRTNPNLSKDLNEVAAVLRKEFESVRSKPFEEVARAFAERFSEAELKSAITFYKTPVGKKLVEFEARTLEEGMTRAQSWANQFSEQVLVRMREEMRKRGHSI